MVKKIYIYYDPKAKVNYIYLFYLYQIAEYDKSKSLYCNIRYKSLKELSERVPISSSALSRILQNKDYNNYLSINKSEKIIVLNNDFRCQGCSGSSAPFVCINQKEYEFLIN